MEANAARYWNMKPWEFRAETTHRQAELMAIYVINNEVEYYYQAESMHQAELSADKHKNERKLYRPGLTFDAD